LKCEPLHSRQTKSCRQTEHITPNPVFKITPRNKKPHGTTFMPKFFVTAFTLLQPLFCLL